MDDQNRNNHSLILSINHSLMYMSSRFMRFILFARIVIDAWSRHKKPGRAKKAKEVFDRMIRLHEQTGTYTCRFAFDKVYY